MKGNYNFGKGYLVVYSNPVTTNYMYFPEEAEEVAIACFRGSIEDEIDGKYWREGNASASEGGIDKCGEEGEYRCFATGTRITLEHENVTTYKIKEA